MAKFAINLKEGELEYNHETIVGIDLGTTNSLVAYIKEGNPICVLDEDGKNALVPSILHFLPQGGILVGDSARRKLVTEPENTIYSVKRLMGKSYNDVSDMRSHYGYTIIDDDQDALVKIKVKDKYYSPVELSAHILTELKQRAEAHLRTKITKAVITVPAYFNDNQRQSTRNAGKLAGLDVLRIVNEPTAAALAYGIGLKPDQAETVAVYDLGGGTFDISILRIEDGIFEVLSTHGDTFLGGDDVDRAIVEHWLAQRSMPKQLLDDKTFVQSLRLLAEQAKKSVAGGSIFSGILQEESWHLDSATLDALVLPILEKTLAACKRALQDAALKTDDIDKVIMVGGSTRLPFIKAGVADFFGKKPYDDLNPDEVVALGAAVQADILAGNQKDLLLLDITPLSLGIETVGGLMDVIIPRNNKVPSKAGRQYTTSIDGQTNLKVAIYQGERDAVEHNRKLGEFVLKGIPPMPAGLPKIDIQFLIDADGILTVIAQELRSGLKQQVVMRPTYGITEEQMGLMLLESIQNAEKDVQFRSLTEARNEANNILLAGDKFLAQNKAILSPEEQANTTQLLAQLRASVQLTDKDAINRAMEQLNAYTTPLAHRALDHNISEAMQGKKV